MANYDKSGVEVDAGNTDSGGLLNVGDLVRMFEEAEDATIDARKNAERDRDYVDNIQHTAEQIATLNKRRQPVVTDNRIKPKIDFVVGLEKQQRIDPRCLPRTPVHESDADGATMALRSVTDTEDYDKKRSWVWRNMLVEGAGAIRVFTEPSRKYPGQHDIKIDQIAWDRMFWDPHSSRHDFSDASYLGIVLWMDYADAVAKWPDSLDALDTTMASATQTDTYDDKPKFTSWADKKRKRVKICQIWIKRNDEWYFAEFTKGGILDAGPSPYRSDSGESECELHFGSAFINRDNERYGYVREMISPQDEINKRRSKTLHALNSSRLIAKRGSFDDIEVARRELVRPDGILEPNDIEGFQIVENTNISEGNFKLLVEAQNSIDLKGPNATMLGDKAGGSSSASGKAIIASQQGGMVSMSDLLDNLRDLDIRVFRALWNRIRQYWTAEKWVRITDDEKNVKWVAVNVHPQQVEMLRQANPGAAKKLAGSISNVAELDCDIIIDEAPDNLTPQEEQLKALVELKKMDVNNDIPFRALVETFPNLRNKDRLLALLDEHEQQRAQQPEQVPPEVIKAQIDGQIQQQTAELDGQIKLRSAAVDEEIAMRKAATDIRIANEKADADMTIAAQRANAANAQARAS